MLGIVRIALSRPYTFIVLALLILIIGPLSALRTPTDIFPDINIPVIAVVWQYTGLSPDQMEGRITSPYERVLTTTVNDVEHIEAKSIAGFGIVKIFFQPGVNIATANAQVTAVSQTLLKQLPAGITPPLILNYNASTVPIIQLALSGKGLSEQNLGDQALNTLRPQLVTVAGAAVPYPYGGKTRQVQIDVDPAALQAMIGPATKLVWLEAPGSVTMEFPPLAELARVCRERGVLTALDNTWGAGLAFNGFDLGHGKDVKPNSGADIVVQALTKYPSGGGDVLMGSIVTRDEALHVQLKLTHMRLGFGENLTEPRQEFGVDWIIRPKGEASTGQKLGRHFCQTVNRVEAGISGIEQMPRRMIDIKQHGVELPAREGRIEPLGREFEEVPLQKPAARMVKRSSGLGGGSAGGEGRHRRRCARLGREDNQTAHNDRARQRELDRCRQQGGRCQHVGGA